MKIKVVDFQSFKDAINKLDGLANDENPKNITITFPHDKDVSKRMEKFFEVADGNGNPEWNV